jgi:hypothetical protein
LDSYQHHQRADWPVGLHGNQRNLERQRDGHLGGGLLPRHCFEHRREILRARRSLANTDSYGEPDANYNNNAERDTHSHSNTDSNINRYSHRYTDCHNYTESHTDAEESTDSATAPNVVAKSASVPPRRGC